MTFSSRRHQRFKERVLSYTIFLLTPIYSLFQLCVIRPYLTIHLNWGLMKQAFHIILGTYLFINVAGNMLLCMITDSRVQSYDGKGKYCENCKQPQPEDSWHCKTCNYCVLRRDHHCVLLGRCIGRNNLRYFICYLWHLTISVSYATYYNYIVLRAVFDLRTFAATASRIFHLGDWSFFAYSPMIFRDRMLIFFWYMNLVTLPVAINFALFHLYKAFKGLTWYEYKKGKVPARVHWKRNMTYVFGKRWYQVLFWPLIESPLVEKPNKRTKCVHLNPKSPESEV